MSDRPIDEAESTRTRRWVKDRLAVLDPPPDWTPNSTRARARMAGLEVGRWSSMIPFGRWAIAAILAGVALIAVSPAVRARAQFWKWLSIARVNVERDRDHPWAGRREAPRLGNAAAAVAARDTKDVAARVGFVPRLPTGRLSESPKLSTLDGASMVTVALLRGDSDKSDGPDWKSVPITLRIGPRVVAEWRDVALVQALPPAVVAAPAIDDASLRSAILRGPLAAFYLSAPLNAANANGQPPPGRLDRRVAAPEMFLGREGNDLRVVDAVVNDRAATLVQHLGEGGRVDWLVLLWNEQDRVYALSGRLNRDAALAIASTVR
jgi:hypothetical protein